MWCKNCKVEINEEICPVCGTKADLDIPVEIYWCDHCKIPLIRSVNDVTKDQCPLCGGETKYLVADLRPVFPEERLLLELLQGVPAYSYAEKSVWASNSRYYIDGKAYALDTKTFEKANTEELRHQLEKYSPGNSDTFFQENITAFLTANQQRLTGKEKGIGIRRGLIPIYIAVAMHKYKNHILIWQDNKEVRITAELLNQINESPESFSVQIEEWTDMKEAYTLGKSV